MVIIGTPTVTFFTFIDFTCEWNMPCDLVTTLFRAGSSLDLTWSLTYIFFVYHVCKLASETDNGINTNSLWQSVWHGISVYTLLPNNWALITECIAALLSHARVFLVTVELYLPQNIQTTQKLFYFLVGGRRQINSFIDSHWLNSLIFATSLNFSPSSHDYNFLLYLLNNPDGRPYIFAHSQHSLK